MTADPFDELPEPPLADLAEALSMAREKLAQPEPSDIVFTALQAAISTIRKLPSEDVGWRIYLMRRADRGMVFNCKAAIDRYELALSTISSEKMARRIARMRAVTWFFPASMVLTRTHSYDRGSITTDWETICRLASGRSAYEVARDFPAAGSKSKIYDRRKLQLNAIARRLCPLIF